MRREERCPCPLPATVPTIGNHGQQPTITRTSPNLLLLAQDALMNEFDRWCRARPLLACFQDSDEADGSRQPDRAPAGSGPGPGSDP
jgi:hypothetical protein